MLLDSDILIDVQRNHPSAVRWFSQQARLPSVPGLVVMELIQDAENNRQVETAMKLVAPLPVVWPTEADCKLALSLFRTFHLSQGLGLLDSLIAACAIGLKTPLCTFNAKHYRAIPELDTRQPYSR